MKKILVINPGSTSTKIAVYEDEQKVWGRNIEHTQEELSKYDAIIDQLDMRCGLVTGHVEAGGYELSAFDAVVSRGGPFARVRSGAYEVNGDMLATMRTCPIDQHASNIGMAIADKIRGTYGMPAFIYDAVTVDEMIPVARVVGLKEMSRRGQGHNLNMRAAALKVCADKDWRYSEKNLLVAHLGGGVTFSLHSGGRVVDMISDDEGSFAPERSGGLPGFQLIDLCFAEGATKKEVLRHIQRRGGLISLLGTPDSREVEKRIAEGDEEAKLVYEAMALSVAKNLAKLAPVVDGAIDAVILTGGIAFSDYFTSMVKRRVAFLGPVEILPGENEMDALAAGALRVLRGEEKAHVFEAAPEGNPS
ncbi:MAG: butyrate kinase [Clostridiales Family XIII bacterium]|jgi:butyrate kinase|nr:butyrate kinase [Clostridiales Family XIII bacterium]